MKNNFETGENNCENNSLKWDMSSLSYVASKLKESVRYF